MCHTSRAATIATNLQHQAAVGATPTTTPISSSITPLLITMQTSCTQHVAKTAWRRRASVARCPAFGASRRPRVVAAQSNAAHTSSSTVQPPRSTNLGLLAASAAAAALVLVPGTVWHQLACAHARRSERNLQAGGCMHAGGSVRMPPCSLWCRGACMGWAREDRRVSRLVACGWLGRDAGVALPAASSSLTNCCLCAHPPLGSVGLLVQGHGRGHGAGRPRRCGCACVARAPCPAAHHTHTHTHTPRSCALAASSVPHGPRPHCLTQCPA
jgi:hypothetical protein